ncbi:hypothetical protein JOD63_000548 [Microbacterium terrae]|uniref:nuclear transport factor 2 family protein n=1 Tax=Microbacterium terrae TaxID=69369 RepID=UPI000695B182|nr:nuclear transport factor 2 family protein [Microbacterium terrae]MBP1076580.1 hypothetical protein [Microbacterium terrae]
MDLAEIRALEEELLTAAARRNPERLSELLHPDFIEIGRSGRRWSRDEIIESLANEGIRDAVITDGWDIFELAPGVALITFVIRTSDRVSRHSSIWTWASGKTQMLFHQGTFVTAR